MSCEDILTHCHSLTIKKLKRHINKSCDIQMILLFKLSFVLVCTQVDDQSVFRHKGERKVKTMEEDMEEVTSRTAELLEEGEELIGRRTL